MPRLTDVKYGLDLNVHQLPQVILMHRSLIITLLDIHSKPLSKDAGPSLFPLLIRHAYGFKVPSFDMHNNSIKEAELTSVFCR